MTATITLPAPTVTPAGEDSGPETFWSTVEQVQQAEDQFRAAARRACLGALTALPAATRAQYPDAVRIILVRGRRLKLTAVMADGTMTPIRPAGTGQGPDVSRHLEMLLGLSRTTSVPWTDAVAVNETGALFMGRFERTGRITIHLDATAARAARLLHAEPLPFTLLPGADPLPT